MGDLKGFMKHNRVLPAKEHPEKRITHFKEFYQSTPPVHKKEQAARCMDCGVPFCHSGCPLGNLIPDFNDAVFKDEWKEAYEILIATNNFPEFTGRICPAPCEAACVLGINSDPVSIEFIEQSIIERAFESGWVKPNSPKNRTGKSVAVIGSGPAGLACADQLNQAGHSVTVFERDAHPGGLLRYGIPDFKLEKNVVERRIAMMEASGIQFKCNTEVGKDLSVAELEKTHQAIVLCGGSTIPRDLPISGRELKGVHFAMEYLSQNNKRVSEETFTGKEVEVKDQDVVVIGGGDTGADCVGTSNRLGAKSVTQIELLSQPGTQRGQNDPWPLWPMTLKTSSSHEEGCEREWSILTKAFLSEDGVHLSGMEVVNIEWKKGGDGKHAFQEIEGTTRTIPCQKVFLAMGFLHPQKEGLLENLGVKLTERGNVETKGYKTEKPHIFAAGDMRRGQSLVVWAISEGREAAREVDTFLTGKPSLLPAKEMTPLLQV